MNKYPASRKEAKKVNSSLYFTGKPCKRGHVELRRTSTSDCLTCDHIMHKEWRKNNKEHKAKLDKEWQQRNCEKTKQYKAKWNSKNPDYNKKWHENRPDYARLKAQRFRERNPDYQKQWEENNKEYVRLYRNAHNKERYKSDVQFRLAILLRKRVGDCIEKKYRSGSAINDLGCTLDQLVTHIESQFQVGMSWDNWGRNGWHIDHILPISSFDLSDRDQFLQACHYTNLQPLWASENISKSNQIKDRRGYLASNGIFVKDEASHE